MAARVTVILGVMAGAFALEVVLPLVRAALRKRREARELEGTQLSSANAGLAKADLDATPPSAVSAPCAPAVQSFFTKVDATEGGDEAQRLWEEAQAMPHQEVADFSTDWQYMALLHKAAKLGHAEACSKIGDHAYRRGAFVEAFFWKWKVESGGGTCVEPSLEEIRADCLASGALTDPGETGGNYGVEEDDFARAVVAVQSGLDMGIAMRRLKELAECGVEEAQLFLNGLSRASQKS